MVQRGFADWAANRRSQTDDLVRAIAVTTTFDGERMVLDGVDLAARRGEVLALMGPSGCGKTTMLRHLCGLLQPTLGSVFVCGQDVYALPPARLQELRLRTGLAFQGGALLGGLTVEQNVALPIAENLPQLPADLARQMARNALDMVGMLYAAELMPGSLSGGMRKRAAIARALVLDPEILFLDEPTAGLDPVSAASIDRLVLRLNRTFGMTTIVVTHDVESVRAIADRVAVFFDGRVAAQGARDDVLEPREPVDQRLRDFLERRLPGDAVAPVTSAPTVLP
ncbi:MAG: ATP-binding cassette domain-containing protein [Planctomycetes bacterium]|nr:ATP-binding cassette domain-containing protein [Planctomycetota bacterium]